MMLCASTTVCGRKTDSVPQPRLSLVFPAYNESARIGSALREALAYLDSRGIEGEVVVVNDGSRDDTLEKAQAVADADPRVRVLTHSPNRGKGYAVREGMLGARGEFRIFLDVDLATPVDQADALLAELEGGADVVIGSRHMAGAVIEVHQSWIRRWMGAAFRLIAAALLPLRVSDVTCGFKGMRGDVAGDLFSVQQETGWAFDAELIFVARKWGLDLRETPVRWRDSGETRVRPLAAAISSFQEILGIRAHDRRGCYVRPGSA